LLSFGDFWRNSSKKLIAAVTMNILDGIEQVSENQKLALKTILDTLILSFEALAKDDNSKN